MSRFRTRASALFASERVWLALYLLVAVIATAICVARRCNNFLIFRAAIDHLAAGRDLYTAYPAEHGDLFKYSPTFALLFAPFAKLPFSLALLGWNVLNVLMLHQSIRLALPPAQRLSALRLAFVGLVTTIDGTQSNGLVAGLIVLSFAALERNRLASAAAAVAAGTLIKVFPLAAVAFVLPRRDRWRFAGIGLAIGIALVALPLVVTSAPTLVTQYRSWYAMGATDALDRGASVMRLFHLFAGYDGPNWPIQLGGIALLLLPIALRPSRWADPDYRRLFLASLLVFSVIFNHKAEQPSFMIAVVGVAIWSAMSPRDSVRTVVTGSILLSTVPILIAVARPGLLAATVDGPLLIASACCTVAWLTMQGELLDLFPERAREPDFATIFDEPAV